MKTLINRLRRKERCGWCEGKGVIRGGTRLRVSPIASCLNCRGKGAVRRRYYYIAIRDAGRTALVAGPYDTREQALARLAEVWDLTCEVDAWAYSYKFSIDESERRMRTNFGRI